MKQEWTRGESEESARHIRAEFRGSALMRRKLTQILQKKQESARKSNLLKSNYDSPSWAFMQADSVGYQRALDEIIAFIEDDVEKE